MPVSLMKIILMQLPLQGSDFFYSNENIPLAAACLKAVAVGQGKDVVLLPQHLMSYGSDQAILRFLLDVKPDLVGMSCYLWNLERSLFLAQQLHRELPMCTVALGGPEITPHNEFLLSHNEFDVGVVGQGERVWDTLLQAFPHVPDIPGLLRRGERGQWHFSGTNEKEPFVRDLPSPYLLGCLDSHLDKILWLETVRGCVHQCAYCHYHKQFKKLEPFSLDRIEAEVRRAVEKGIEEIVFLDPCFAERPGFEKLLDLLGKVTGERKLHFHAELNAEDINPTRAEKLGKVGFSQVEVGLQSINRETLKMTHRRFRPRRFLQGVRSLQDHGIEVIVDLIAGLPGDRLQDVHKSMDWVLKHDAFDTLMLYPLSLLASTELHQRASDLGLSALLYPPYLVTRTQNLSAPEMCEAFRYYEQCMEDDVAPIEMPFALDPQASSHGRFHELITQIHWQGRDDVQPLSRLWSRTAYALTVTISREVLRQPSLWISNLREYLEHNPFSLLSIEVPADVFPEDLAPLWGLARGHSHFADRDYTVPHTPYRSFLVFSRAQGLIWKWPDPRESYSLELPDGQKVPSHPICCVATTGETIPEWFTNHMSKRYASLPEMRLWQPPEDNSPALNSLTRG
jgi:radical SAM superfamily enzyme YgiQ (UPF0313 family)